MKIGEDLRKGSHVYFTNVDDNGITARVIDQTLKRNMLSNEPNVMLYTYFPFYAFK